MTQTSSRVVLGRSAAFAPDTASANLQVLAASPTLIAFAHGDHVYLAERSGEVIRTLSPSATVRQVNGDGVLLRDNVDGSPVPCFVVENAIGDSVRELCDASSAAVGGGGYAYTDASGTYFKTAAGTKRAVPVDGLIDNAGPRGFVSVADSVEGPVADFVRFGPLDTDPASAVTSLQLPAGARSVTCPSIALTRALCRVTFVDGAEQPVLIDLEGGVPVSLGGDGYVGAGDGGGYVGGIAISEEAATWTYESGVAYWRDLGTGATTTFDVVYTGLVSSGSTLIGSTDDDLFTVDAAGLTSSIDLRVPGAASREPAVSAPRRTFEVSSVRAFPVAWSTARAEDGTRYKVKWRKAGSGTWEVWKNNVAAGSASFGANGSPVTPREGATYEFLAIAVDAFGQVAWTELASARVAFDQEFGVVRGTWRENDTASAWLGSTLSTRQEGASYMFSTGGGKVSVIGGLNDVGAKFAVYVDGRKVDVVSTYSRRAKVRQVLWTGSLSGRSHTIKLVKLGGRGTTLVLDGIDLF
jgi:hypothetical protein